SATFRAVVSASPEEGMTRAANRRQPSHKEEESMRFRRIGVCSIVLLAFLAALLASAPADAQQATRWPSLGSQLLRDHVRPGSALEGMIRGNQEFGLYLDPREATDSIRIPLWLRVNWRKAHPEMTYSPDDPSGGYPLVLKEVHEWMV